MNQNAAAELDLRRRGWAFIREGWHKVAHGQGDDCPGWLEVLKGNHEAVQPCDVCQPGLHAVFNAGLFRGDWDRNPAAIRVYLEAQIAGDRPLPKAPNNIWDRIQRSFVGA